MLHKMLLHAPVFFFFLSFCLVFVYRLNVIFSPEEKKQCRVLSGVCWSLRLGTWAIWFLATSSNSSWNCLSKYLVNFGKVAASFILFPMIKFLFIIWFEIFYCTVLVLILRLIFRYRYRLWSILLFSMPTLMCWPHYLF